jgi:hypothetical protein
MVRCRRIAYRDSVRIREGSAYVVNDTGGAQPEYPVVDATYAAIADDGAVLYVHADGTLSVCGDSPQARGACQRLSTRVEQHRVTVVSRTVRPNPGSTVGRFILVTGTDTESRMVDPEHAGGKDEVMRRVEAQFRATLLLNHIALSDQRVVRLLDALVREAADTSAATEGPITDWHFFRVVADEHLYAPVLQFARQETVFPSAFETLDALNGARSDVGRHDSADALYDRYLRLSLKARRNGCTVYFRTLSAPGSWFVEYWLYYPFDVGGFGSHVHDPEHMFVEVDKLGSAVRRVIGAGHGYMAGNTSTTPTRPAPHPSHCLPSRWSNSASMQLRRTWTAMASSRQDWTRTNTGSGRRSGECGMSLARSTTSCWPTIGR